MPDLSLVGFRVLREVAARGSFTAAADTLGYTQSAVSRQIATMEAAAGAPLFRRASRGVRLTESGRVLLRRADRVLDEVEAAQRELSGVRESATGRLRVGAFPTAVAALLPRAVAAFRVHHAGVEVSLREGTTPGQLRRLGSGTTELAVVGTLPGQPLSADRLIVEPLLDDPLLLAVGLGHPLARRGSVDLGDLAEELWIAGSTNPHDTFLGAPYAVDWEPRVAFVAREWTAKLGLVAAGLGVTLVPGLAATAVRDDVALIRLRAEAPVMRSVLLATRSGGEQAPHVRAFADELHRAAGELALTLQRRIEDR